MGIYNGNGFTIEKKDIDAYQDYVTVAVIVITDKSMIQNNSFEDIDFSFPWPNHLIVDLKTHNQILTKEEKDILSTALQVVVDYSATSILVPGDNEYDIPWLYPCETYELFSASTECALSYFSAVGYDVARDEDDEEFIIITITDKSTMKFGMFKGISCLFPKDTKIIIDLKANNFTFSNSEGYMLGGASELTSNRYVMVVGDFEDGNNAGYFNSDYIYGCNDIAHAKKQKFNW